MIDDNEIKIANISLGSKNIAVTGEIIEIGEVREVNTRYGMTKVVETLIEDETGKISMTVWGEMIDKIREGDKIRVKKAYASEWNNRMQINIGRFGKLIILNN